MITLSPIADLKDRHVGTVAHFVGKGPSADTLDAAHFGSPGPVLAHSDAIKKVLTIGLSNEFPIYLLQGLGAEENQPRSESPAFIFEIQFGVPVIFVPFSRFFIRQDKPLDAYFMLPKQHGLEFNDPLFCFGIKAAQIMGCVSAIFYGGDSIVNGDPPKYASFVTSYTCGQFSPPDYATQKEKILAAAGEMPVSWVI